MGPYSKSAAALQNNDFLKKWGYFYALLPFLLLITFAACNRTETAAPGYSRAFKIIFNQTTHYFDHNQPDKAIHYLDSAFREIKSPTIDDRFRFYGFHYILAQKARLDFKQAMLYADSMLMMAGKSVTKEQYVSNFAEGNYAKGDTYFSLKQYNDAYQCYFQGYLVARNYLHKASLADYTYRMGMIMYKQDHYKLAASYFKESLQQSAEMKDDFPEFYRKQELMDNIAISYKHNGDLDSAITYFDKTLHYIDANAGKFKERADMLEIARGVVYGNKAEVLISKGKNVLAREMLKRSIAINLRKAGDNRDAELAEIKLGQLYLTSHKNDSLINLLQSIRKQLDSVKNDDAEADWNRLMGSYYLNNADLAKAIHYTQVYNSLKDSTIKRLTVLKESDVNQQLANLEKQYEIENLNNNNKLQRTYLDVAIVCATLLAVIVFLIWRNWIKSKSDVAMVTSLNEQINEQKANLEEALAEINTRNQEKDRILRAVAHDLRNPLGGIASLTSVMVEETEHDKDLNAQLKLIRETATDTLELINEILEATNNSSSPLKKQWVDVNLLLNNSIELLRFKAAEKHQQITFDGLDHAAEINLNREKIWRVISNLISNAIKFSAVGETINVKTIRGNNQVVISIKDHGIGIPDNMKDKIFNMFTDAKRPGTIGEKSFGLGLSISKQIIEKHHGKIWFESEAGKGSTFYVSLPAAVKPKTAHAESRSGETNEVSGR
ncbi:MAG: HAMP domain-containing histidine kinase [Bacteroidetes bacterium]|nr:HAMP domain-containing histidine kinase [Bacteroidota bacterium]